MAFKPIPYEEPAAGFQPIPYEEPASGFQPIPYEASFTPIPYEEPAPAVAAKPAAVPAVDPNIPPVASANSNQIAEVERWFAETQENEKTRTPVRDVLRDVAAIPGEIPKAFSRGVERLEGSVGPLISAVGDYVDTQQRQWNRVFAESPFGQFVGRRKQEKYIKKHGALPEPSIQAGKATAGERISTFGEGIYDWWNEAANTGWEAPDEKIYGGSFIENPSLTRVVGGAAESAPTMIGAMALSAAGHPGAGAALLAGSESAPIYIEAKRAGASESDAFAFALVSGLGTAALERVGLDAVMGKNPLVDEVIQKLGAKWYTGALVNFAVEGSQESLQEIYQNAVAMGWDGDRQLLDGALEAGLSGGLLGAGGSTARSVYSSFMQKQADKAKSMTDAQIDAAVRESMRPENAQIQLVRKDGQPTPAPVPGGDVAAPKGQTVQVDVSGQGPVNPAMQQRLIELLNQAQPMPPSPAPAMLAAPQDQVPAALPLPDFTANREDNAPRSTTTGAAVDNKTVFDIPRGMDNYKVSGLNDRSSDQDAARYAEAVTRKLGVDPSAYSKLLRSASGVARPKKIYRGVDENTGNRSASEGYGLYVTGDVEEAGRYGAVSDVSLDELPRNPAYFRDYGEFKNFLIKAADALGVRRITDITNDPSELLIAAGYDGAMFGSGKTASFVNYKPANRFKVQSGDSAGQPVSATQKETAANGSASSLPEAPQNQPADGVGVAVSGGVSVDLVTSLYAEAAPGMDMASLSKEIAAAFNGKDVETLRKWTMHGRGFNDATKRVVFKMIGMPVPSNIKGIGEALDRWAGVSVQERTQRDGELRRKKMIKQAESEIKMSGRYAAGINVDVDGSIVDGKAWIDSLWADGYDRVVKLKNGKYGLVNKDGNGWPLKKADLRAYAQAREALDKAQEPAFSVSGKPINETQPSLRSTGETQSGARVIRGYDLPVTFGFRERGERNGLDNIEGERIRVGGAGGPLDLLLKMAKEQPEFKRDPVFVARDRQLVFLGKGGRLAINPQLLGIDPQTLIEGDEVRVDLDELAGAKKLLQRATKAFEGKTRTELEQEATNRGIGDVFNKALASASVPELRQRLIADEFQRLAGELGRAAAEQPRGGRRGYAYETAGAAKGGDASGGVGSAGVPVDDPLYSNLPIEMPELVEFAELLGQGKLPKIREKLGRAIGLFRFQRDNPDSGSIELRADIFNLVQPEDKQRLRGEALEYARKIKELDPNADETKVYRDRYDYLYDQLLAERKKQDPVLARKTLPHEIGHWVDLLPEWLISRGNILGHIAALKGYTKTLLSEKPGSPGPLTDKERAALRRRAEKELKALRGEVREIVEEIVREEPIYKEFPVTPDDVKGLVGLNAREATPELYEWFAKQERATKKQILKAAMQGLVDERAASFGRREKVGTRTTRETVRRTVDGEPITKEQIRQRYRELLKEEVARRRLHELETIKAELEGAIAWWNGTEKMPDYYRKPEEMFADAYSIFINNPQALAKRAPGFFKAMMDYMDARPHVRAIYDRLQEDIRSGAIYRNRVKRLHKAFEEGDASMFDRQNAGRQKSATEWIDAVRYSVDAVFGPMEARVRRSGVSADKAGEIGASIENYLYRATGHEYYMGRMHQEVVRPLLENDLQWSDLSELMFHNRVINERHSMANPLGWTPKSSQERLDEMKARIGPQRWAVLDRARSNLWALNGTVREMIREAGLFTPELLDRIDENLHYATFAVMRDGSTGNPGSIEEMLENAFGTNTGPKIYRQLGTLKKVQDPAAATAMKMLSLMDAARRNVAKTELVDLLRNEFPGEIKAADMRWNGIYREIVVRESERAGMIVVMRNGKPEGWYVPKVFVSAFERGNTVENQVLMKMLSAPSRAVKNLYTQLNYGFWPVAFVRDVMAFKVKMPRVSNVPFGGPQFWRHFGRALVDSWSSVMGAPNAGALESLSKQDWITVANPMASRGEGEAIDKLMQRYWQDPANINADRPVIAAVMRAFTKWMELGQVFERTVKRAGRLYLDRNFKEMPEWRKQYIVHNYSGSPNFLRKGALNPVLDFAALFYNPWKESIRSTFRRFKESPATMAWNTAKYAVAPKVMMWLFASGAMTVVLKELFGDDGEEFGRDVERMFRYVPEYDKANYTIIPLGWDDRENNKVACLRLPLAEEMRIPAALTWKMLNKSGDYQQSINYMGGQLPVGNPILEVLSAWRQYLSGRNPYDWFRGQLLLDDNVAEARDWRGAAAMGKYTWNALGGSIIHRFNLQDYDDDKTKTERFLDLPVISNALGRWVKVSNRGLADKLRQEVSVPLRQDQARSRRDASSALQSGDMDRIEKLKIQDPRAEAYILNNSSDIFKRKAMKPEESMILFAPTVEERTALETELMKYR